jgi:hypothetical protein
MTQYPTVIPDAAVRFEKAPPPTAELIRNLPATVRGFIT